MAGPSDTVTPRAGNLLARVIGHTVAAVLRPLDPLLSWLVLLRPKARVAGFAISVERYCADPDSVVARLTDAIYLLDAVDPLRLARIRRDAPRLHVGLVGHAAMYSHRPPTIAWRDEVLLAQPVLWAASALVHEGTHARIHGAGIRTTAATRARIERRCVAEEIHFLRKAAAHFPEYASQAEHFIAHAERELAMPVPWYAPSQKWARVREELVRLEAPRWLLWLFDGLEPDRSRDARDHGG